MIDQRGTISEKKGKKINNQKEIKSKRQSLEGDTVS